MERIKFKTACAKHSRLVTIGIYECNDKPGALKALVIIAGI